jgi:hypothetical protein
MRIATWNLDRPCKGSQICPDHVLAEIAAVADVDVWVLTEVYPDPAFTELNGFRPLTQSATAPGKKSWTAIWIRNEICDAEEIDVCEQESTRAACVFLPTTDVGPLYVYGSVLWGGDGRKYAQSLNYQKEDWQRLRRLKPDAAFCLAGDLNQPLNNVPESGEPNMRGLRDALINSNLTCLTAHITHYFQDRPCDLLPGIDHICVSHRLAASSSAFLIPEDFRKCSFRIPEKSTNFRRVGSWYAPNGRLSDHHGVVATLTS